MKRTPKRPRGKCAFCGAVYSIRKTGKVRFHRSGPFKGFYQAAMPRCRTPAGAGARMNRWALLAGLGLLLAAAWSERAWIRCALLGRHDPVRNFIGGFRCRACGASGADLGELGFEGSSDVPTMRRTFARGRSGGMERVTSWAEPERAARRDGWVVAPDPRFLRRIRRAGG